MPTDKTQRPVLEMRGICRAFPGEVHPLMDQATPPPSSREADRLFDLIHWCR